MESQSQTYISFDFFFFAMLMVLSGGCWLLAVSDPAPPTSEPARMSLLSAHRSYVFAEWPWQDTLNP